MTSSPPKKRHLLLPLAVALIVGLTILSGYVQGKMSRRWSVPLDLVTLGKALDNFPKKIGPWQLISADKLSDTVVQTLECTGYVLGNYVNSETGENVNLGLIFGPSGPISVHTPDICYSSQAYEHLNEPKTARITGAKGENAEFWTQTFKAKTVEGELLRVYYSWRAGGVWRAFEGSRIETARYPYLYKVQVAAPLASTDSERDPAKEFLRDFLSVANTELK